MLVLWHVSGRHIHCQFEYFSSRISMNHPITGYHGAWLGQLTVVYSHMYKAIMATPTNLVMLSSVALLCVSVVIVV